MYIKICKYNKIFVIFYILEYLYKIIWILLKLLEFFTFVGENYFKKKDPFNII